MKVINQKYYLKLDNGKTFNKKLEITIWNWNPVILIFNAEVLSGYNVSIFKNYKIICVGYSIA